MKLIPHPLKTLVLAACTLASLSTAPAAIVGGDPAPGGIGYEFSVALGATDTATVQGVVSTWSWEDSNVLNAGTGWTHTSNWFALELAAPSVFTVQIARKEGIPIVGDAEHPVADTSSMYPSFTLWKGWDNDQAPQEVANEMNGGTPFDEDHAYNNRGNVAWAEDLTFVTYVDNSTAFSVQRTYLLPAGKYTLVLGSHAPSTNSQRQGYEATFTTAQIPAPTVEDDSYFSAVPTSPISASPAAGVLANDVNVAANYTLQVVKAPTYGSVVVAADGSFTYTPGAYFGVVGTDHFTYQMVPAGDVQLPVGPATVTVSTAEAIAGRYTGLLFEESDTVADGIIQLMVTAKSKFTGYAFYAGKRYPLSGTVQPGGKLTLRKQPSAELNLALLLRTENDGAQYVAATLQQGLPVVAQGRIDQSPYSRMAMAPMKGTHKVTLTPIDSGAGLPPNASRGTLRIGADGAATFVGKLGDGGAFSVSSSLIVGSEAGPTLPVFAGMYARKEGELSGQLTFGAAALSDAFGILHAIKPPQRSGKFKEGFTLDYDATTGTPK